MRNETTTATIAAFYFTILSAVCAVGLAQESDPKPAPASKSAAGQLDESGQLDGFEWLKQFEGSWITVSKSSGKDSESMPAATLDCRIIGNHWIVCEHRGQIGDLKFEAVQTVGFDDKTEKFIGTWVDSMLSHTWRYNGSLDKASKKLTLNCDGPEAKQYRDIYEFKSENEIAGTSQFLNDDGNWETFMTSKMTRSIKADAKTSVTPFLMFEGNASEAIDFYKTVFPNLKIDSMEKYGSGDTGKEGSIKLATFIIDGQPIKCTDSPIEHGFTFTPSFSFFVECESEEQLAERFAKLSTDGKVMMPIDNYGFSKKFGWASDRFGISWQLNLK